jgi:hypothetical protein
VKRSTKILIIIAALFTTPAVLGIDLLLVKILLHVHGDFRPLAGPEP